MKIALGIAYDGSDYCGWQCQPNGGGVQDALEVAIANIAQSQVRVHAAGRTDAGVHGLGQVVHFETQTHRPTTAWVRGVNAHLPVTIRVKWAHEVDDSFHARFSARSRSYQYVLYNAPVATPLMANKAGWFHVPLDLQAMSEAASYLVGEHDFSGCRASECQAQTAVRTMALAQVKAVNQYVMFEFTANAFLQHQVRNMVGALVYIGKGAHPPAYIKELLLKANRTLSPPTFSPNGLYLTHVGYESQWGLPTSAQSGIQVVI